MFQKITKN